MDLLEKSEKILRRIQQNDATLRTLYLGDLRDDHDRGDKSLCFNSSKDEDFSSLGECLEENTALRCLKVTSNNRLCFIQGDDNFYDGLKLNSSISALELHCGNRTLVSHLLFRKLLEIYQGKNILTCLLVQRADLIYGGDAIANTLRSCTNLQSISLIHNSITDDILFPIIDAMRNHYLLKDLCLAANMIGDDGCEAIEELLQDTNCTLRFINLEGNRIGLSQ